MEVILQSEDEFNKIGVLNLSSKELQIFSKKKKPYKEPHRVFKQTESGVVCFFRLKEGLSIVVDKQLIILESNDKVSIWDTDDTRKLFKIERGMDNIFSMIYTPPLINPPLSAYQFFSPVEEENFDIFLLIHNVFNNFSRRRLFYNSRPLSL